MVEEPVKCRGVTDFETEGMGDPSETGVHLSYGVMFRLVDCGAFEHQYSSTILRYVIEFVVCGARSYFVPNVDGNFLNFGMGLERFP